MLLVTFTVVVQQIMNQFLNQRMHYEIREQPSQVYSWVVFLTANMVVESGVDFCGRFGVPVLVLPYLRYSSQQRRPSVHAPPRGPILYFRFQLRPSRLGICSRRPDCGRHFFIPVCADHYITAALAGRIFNNRTWTLAEPTVHWRL